MPTNQDGQSIIFKGEEKKEKLTDNKLDHYRRHLSHQKKHENASNNNVKGHYFYIRRHQACL